MSLVSKNSINIITPVIIKSIVTEELIDSVRARINESLDALNKRLNQIQYQKEFLTMQSKNQDISKDTIINVKKAEQETKSQINKIEEQSKRVDSWQLGQEVIMTQKDSIKQFTIGDIFTENQVSEIVVRNGVIIEIRE